MVLVRQSRVGKSYQSNIPTFESPIFDKSEKMKSIMESKIWDPTEDKKILCRIYFYIQKYINSILIKMRIYSV